MSGEAIIILILCFILVFLIFYIINLKADLDSKDIRLEFHKAKSKIDEENANEWKILAQKYQAKYSKSLNEMYGQYSESLDKTLSEIDELKELYLKEVYKRPEKDKIIKTIKIEVLSCKPYN